MKKLINQSLSQEKLRLFGDFFVKMDSNDRSFKLGRGDVIAFPSWMLHKVSPVIRGMRRTLVGWGNGPLL